MVAVGDVLDGRYRLDEVLGEGASSTVWLARDVDRGIDVAVKTLRPRFASSKRMLGRFLREGELGERMMSPHIVRVLARGIANENVPYTVYEHLEGRDLATVLREGGPLSFADTRIVVLHTCRALARAHAVGVMHRDVKPENLFTTTESRRLHVKVLDFGVAQVACSIDADRPVVGTLEYIAPDVLLGENESDARSDLYSLGVVAYECLTGRVPFPASNVGELVLAHAKGERPKLDERRDDVPAALEKWMDRALARDPENRFASAKEMADSLEAAIAGVALRTSKPVSQKKKSLRPQRPSGPMSYKIIPRRDDD
jgi:serine/threonine-protein kinase